MKTTVLLFILLISSSIGLTQISVDESLTPQELVEDVLMNNPAFTVSNIDVVSGSNFGAVNSVGAFNKEDTDFPFSGILLSSGAVSDATGPNDSFNSSGSWSGDSDLNTLPGGFLTNDASSISFDFTSSLSTISFNIIYASEEYDQNFECSFGDPMAILLTNLSTGNSINIGAIPGTNIPISANNIHPEISGGCSAVNEEFFGQYNFQPFNDPALSPTDYNGQTAVISIMQPLEIDTPYNLKIVIGDDGDSSFDSTLFIQRIDDSDGDTIVDTEEDINNNGNLDDDDTDDDGIPNYLDDDDDGDTVSTMNETAGIGAGEDEQNSIDTDGDLTENYLDNDDDGDGILTINEDYNNNGDPIDDDINNNGIPDFLDEEVALSTDTFELSKFAIYPNPVINEVSISSKNAFAKAFIYNITGQLVLSYNGENKTIHQLDLSSLKSGVFFLKINSSEKVIKFLKK
jgi:hypothetical protein